MTSFRFVLAPLVLATAVAPLAAQQEGEKPKVPKDSVQVTVLGCLKGRVLTAADVRQPDVSSGPVVRQRAFRVAGKKDVMKDIKANDGQRVEVVGLIKKSALTERGMKFKGGRVVVGGGTSMGSSGTMHGPDPAENTVVMDVASVQALGGSCGGDR
jgi:hypothetical protein